jgi:hypothetical protein
MKIGSGIVIGKDDAAGASAVRKPPEDRRSTLLTLTLMHIAVDERPKPCCGMPCQPNQKLYSVPPIGLHRMLLNLSKTGAAIMRHVHMQVQPRIHMEHMSEAYSQVIQHIGTIEFSHLET